MLIYMLKFKNENNEIVGIYIGKTKNLKKRIESHKRCRNSDSRPINLAIRKFKFDYEILSLEIDDYEFISILEYESIKIVKDMNLKNFNIFIGNKFNLEYKNKFKENRLGNKNPFYNKKHSIETRNKISNKSKGLNNANSKNLKHFELTSRTRTAFKLSCKSKGYDFNDFNEIFYGWKVKPSNKRERVYIYIYKN